MQSLRSCIRQFLARKGGIEQRKYFGQQLQVVRYLYDQVQPSQGPKFCVVGCGPAGFYTTQELLTRFKNCSVDMIDRLPTPRGLVRSGVAPDHQNTKWYHGVVLAYGAEEDQKLNIPGETIKGIMSAREFVWWYNGHPDVKDLPVDLANVRKVVIIGAGNVAIDCARILLKGPKELQNSDIPEHAMKQLKSSTVRSVKIVARRSPTAAAFTTAELREIISLPNVSSSIHPHPISVSELQQRQLQKSRGKARVLEILKLIPKNLQPYENIHGQNINYAQKSEFSRQAEKALKGQSVNWNKVHGPLYKPDPSPKRVKKKGGWGLTGVQEAPASKEPSIDRLLQFQFFNAPVTYSADEHGYVFEVQMALNEVAPTNSSDDDAEKVRDTGDRRTIQADLVLQSIGYKVAEIQGVPYDKTTRTIPNLGGQVIQMESNHESENIQKIGDENGTWKNVDGLFVAGWAKRGPTGIIGTNIVDAKATVRAMKTNLREENLLIGKPGGEELKQHLDTQGTDWIDKHQWHYLEQFEINAGKADDHVKPRIKVTDVQQMIDVAKQFQGPKLV